MPSCDVVHVAACFAGPQWEPLQDAACRQALLARSSAAAAAPAELMLAQLAATIAEELAAVMHAQQPTAPEDGLPNARHELFEYMIGTLYA
jgi:hypothetical protein